MQFQFNEYEERDADFWNDEFEDDNYQQREQEFVPEMGAFERVGIGRADEGGLGVMIGGGAEADNLRDAHKKILRMDLSGPEKLRLLIDDYGRKYYDSSFWKLQQDDMTQIYQNISRLNEPGYKNPVAYMLGYYVIDKDGRINKKRFEQVVKDMLPQVQKDIHVKSEDVLRYARLWGYLK